MSVSNFSLLPLPLDFVVAGWTREGRTLGSDPGESTSVGPTLLPERRFDERLDTGEEMTGDPELPTFRHLPFDGGSFTLSLSPVFSILSTIGGRGSLSSDRLGLDADIGLDKDPLASDLLLVTPPSPLLDDTLPVPA